MTLGWPRRHPYRLGVSFVVSADSYGQFMGRFSGPLAEQFLAELDLQPGMRALDVGSGPGALTALLVEQLGAANVVAADPSEPFVAALRERFPGVEVHQAPAESIPLPDASVDVAAAQLVIHFMPDPTAGVAEMGRVTRAGGLVAASCWDFEGDRSPLAWFWDAVRQFEPEHPGEVNEAGAREGQIGEYFRAAGLHDVREATVTAHVEIASFDEYWTPFTLGVGPAGAYVAALDESGKAELRAACEALFPPTPCVLDVTAWAGYGRV